MSFWPGKGPFSSRNKRLQRVRLVWRPPERSISDTIADPSEVQSTKGSPASKSSSSKQKDNQEEWSKSCDGSQKKTSKYEKHKSRGRKRRNVKPIRDQSSNSEGSEKVGTKTGESDNKEDLEVADEKGSSEESDTPVSKKKSRKKKPGRRPKKSRSKQETNIIDKKEDDMKLKSVKLHDAGGSDDHLKRLERDWEDAGDSGGQISRCSSSSSLSSSCSHHSLIKHYTNIMMNCCDDQYDEDCNVVKNKIDRILKSQWKDRLNRSKDKPSGSTESHSPTPQTSAKHSSTFKLRPARLPLNKKTWSKLKKSNQNTDWLFNNDS